MTSPKIGKATKQLVRTTLAFCSLPHLGPSPGKANFEVHEKNV